ncbi:MAG: hypothetical protein OXN84_10045 [Albidovulum sp.]|nr:hypothetical protein [Albidovulum sp.]
MNLSDLREGNKRSFELRVRALPLEKAIQISMREIDPAVDSRSGDAEEKNRDS